MNRACASFYFTYLCSFFNLKQKNKEDREIQGVRRKAHEIPVVLCVFLSLNYKGKEITRELSEMNTTHHTTIRLTPRE